VEILPFFEDTLVEIPHQASFSRFAPDHRALLWWIRQKTPPATIENHI
jgi:hypothetical protein